MPSENDLARPPWGRVAALLVFVLALSGCVGLGEPSTTGPEAAATSAVANSPAAPPSQPSPGASSSAPKSAGSTPGLPGGLAITPIGPQLATHCPGTDQTPGARPGRGLTGSSLNWSGYVSVVRRSGVTCVEGSWIQPTVTCPKTGSHAVAIWIGIDGFASRSLGIPATSSLVQIGTQVDCHRGLTIETAWHEVLPAEQHEVRAPGAVRSGDHIAARILYLGGGRFLMTLTDRESGLVFSRSVTARAAPRRSAEWIVEAPATDCPKTCRIVSLPRFAPIAFGSAHATIGGGRGGVDDDRWAHVRLQLSRNGIVRTSASRLSSGGTQFRVTWAHT